MNDRPSLTPEQCRAARGLLAMSQGDLCSLANVALKSMSDFENEKTAPYRKTLADIRAALEAAGVEFLDPDNGGPGVRLKNVVARLVRRQASSGTVVFFVDYAGDEIKCQFGTEILDDWDRTSYGKPALFEAAFDSHQNTIMVRAQAAIEAGRSDDGVVRLLPDDFPEIG